MIICILIIWQFNNKNQTYASKTMFCHHLSVSLSFNISMLKSYMIYDLPSKNVLIHCTFFEILKNWLIILNLLGWSAGQIQTVSQFWVSRRWSKQKADFNLDTTLTIKMDGKEPLTILKPHIIFFQRALFLFYVFHHDFLHCLLDNPLNTYLWNKENQLFLVYKSQVIWI